MIQIQALVDRCVGGDEPAWRELHARFHPLAYAFLRRLGVRPPELDDACQEVFVQVFRYLARFEHRSDLKTWLYKLCISQAARVRRRAALGATLRRLFGSEDPGLATVGREWSEPEMQRRVHVALGRLKEIHRTVFVLYELEGLPGDEVAQVTGLPAATVRRRLHNARKEFEAALDEVAGR